MTSGTPRPAADGPATLAWAILYVDDLRAGLDFYARAFGLAVKLVDEAGTYGELSTGATTLALCSRASLEIEGKRPGRPDPHAPSQEIAFAVGDVVAAVERAVAAGATLIQAPEAMPWGQTVAYVADPDGFLIELCTPMAAQVA